MLGKIRDMLFIALLAMSVWAMVQTFGLPQGFVPRLRSMVQDFANFIDQSLSPLEDGQ